MDLKVDNLSISRIIYHLAFIETVMYLSFDMVLPALPKIIADLHVSNALEDYTIIIWSLGSGLSQLLYVPYVYTQKKYALFIGVLGFILSTLYCAITDNIFFFLFSRFIEGFSVCFFSMSSNALICELYSTKESIHILSLLSMVTVLAPAIGPSLGAMIISYHSWRLIFCLLSILALAGILNIYSVTGQGLMIRVETQICAAYFKVICNRLFLKVMLLYSLSISSIIIWNIKSPFIIMKECGETEVLFGLYQFIIFSFFILGNKTTQYLNKINKQLYTIKLSIAFSFIGGLSLLISDYIFNNLYCLIPSIISGVFGLAISLSILNRYCLNASVESTAIKISVMSIFITLFTIIFNKCSLLLNSTTIIYVAILFMMISVVKYKIFTTIDKDDLSYLHNI